MAKFNLTGTVTKLNLTGTETKDVLTGTQGVTLGVLSGAGPQGPQGEQGVQGVQGPAGPTTVDVGATTTLSAGSSATVTNTGDTTDAVFAFGIPQGVAGTDGADGGRNIPQNTDTGTVTLDINDAGDHISISSPTGTGVTVPANVFSVGDVVTVYNNSTSNLTITEGTNVTLRQAGTANDGNRTLAQYGVCTIMCVADVTDADVFVIAGAGLS